MEWGKKYFRGNFFILPSLLTLMLFISAFFLFLLPDFENSLKKQRKKALSDLTSTVWHLVEYYHQQSQNGRLSEQEAQTLARKAFRAFRYGPENKDYFWIHTIKNPVLLVHPYLQEWENKPLKSFPDALKKLFEKYLATIREKPSGYIDYQWQWHDKSHRILPKTSFIKRFEPWGWVVGTGTYMHDLKADAEGQIRHFFLISSLIFLFILLIIVYIIHQNLKMKKKELEYQEKLRENEEKYRLIIEHSFDVIWTADLNMNFTFISPSVTKLLGFTPEECLKLGPKTTLTPESLVITAQALAEEIEKEKQKPGTGGNRTLILEQNHKNGETVWTEVVTFFIRKNNQLTGVSGTTRDITQKRKAEHALFESEQLFKSLIEYGSDMIMLVAMEGEIQYASPSFKYLMGFRPEELIGENILSFVSPLDMEQMAELLAQSIKEPTTYTEKEIKIFNKQGETRILFFTGKSLYTNSAVNGIVLNARDITQNKLSAQQLQIQKAALERSNHELEQFAYITSHDLKQPLHTILGFTELLKMQFGEKIKSEAKEYLDYIIQGAKRMNQLIDDLLQYSRVTTAQEPFKETDLNDLLHQVIQDLFAMVQEKKPELLIPPLPVISCDAGQISRLFQNLISNALKFNDKQKPVIELEVKEEADYWIFNLKDNGIGIDSIYLDSVFQIFKRAHNKEGYSGSGIGLAICEKIVVRHGGHISATSQVGAGSVFSFSLAKNLNKQL